MGMILIAINPWLFEVGVSQGPLSIGVLVIRRPVVDAIANLDYLIHIYKHALRVHTDHRNLPFC
jgi:hypothetical protein